MTKKEHARMEQLERELRVAKALRWTEEVPPDVPIPADGSPGVVNGYAPCYNRVDKACTSNISHSFGRWDKTDSQNARCLWSTRLLALRALRYEWEIRSAEILAGIDRQIEEEIPHE